MPNNIHIHYVSLYNYLTLLDWYNSFCHVTYWYNTYCSDSTKRKLYCISTYRKVLSRASLTTTLFFLSFANQDSRLTYFIFIVCSRQLTKPLIWRNGLTGLWMASVHFHPPTTSATCCWLEVKVLKVSGGNSPHWRHYFHSPRCPGCQFSIFLCNFQVSLLNI